MSQGTQRIHRFSIQEYIQFHQVGMAERIDVIIEGSISLGNTLQFIVEIDHNLAQRQHEVQLHTVTTHVFLVNQFATLIQTKLHNRTDVIGCGDDGGTDIWLLDMVNHRWVWQSRRVVNLLLAALLVVYHIRYVRHGGDNIHVELAVQTLLHNFHVEQSKESTTETEAEGYRRLWRECQ